jgi:hypothetical protein
MVHNELVFFSLFRNSEWLAGTFRWSEEIPVQPGWYLPPRKFPIAENKFFQVRELKYEGKIQVVLYGLMTVNLELYSQEMRRWWIQELWLQELWQ